MDNIYKTAQTLAQESYKSSEAYQSTQGTELDLLAEIRDVAKSGVGDLSSYKISNEGTKGLATGSYGVSEADWKEMEGLDTKGAMDYDAFHGHAYSLKRVPYDGYPALLHRDEQILTASKARERDGGGLQVAFSGPITVLRTATWRRSPPD